MTLVKLDPIPKRTTQGVPLSSYQHDEIHEGFRTAINALIDAVSTSSGSGGGVPIGTLLPFGGSSLPTGWVWANGQILSTVAYPALYAIYGTTYNTGGESPTQFRVPNVIGKAVTGTNPMGGVTVGGYTTRGLGVVYGAETNSYTPSGSVSQASLSSVTATSSALSTSSITATVSQATATSSAPSVSGITATSSAIDTSGLGVNVVLTNGALTGGGTLNVDGIVCSQFNNNEKSVEAITCTALTIDLAAIATSLSTNVGVQSASISGSIPTPTITIGGSIAAPTITVSSQTVTIGGTIPTPTITIGGSIPTQTFSGVTANISTLQPSIAMNWIIKY